MIPEKVFHHILALGEGWRVQQVDYLDKESKVLIRVENTPALWVAERCPHCGRTGVQGYDHAPERRWRHLNVCQLQSEIVCRPPRGRCGACEKIYTVRAPWEGRSRGLTQEFEAFALTLMREMPVSKAGEILGETDTKLWRALFAHVDAAWSELSWENVVWVGADEMNRKKGHNYLTVFVDLQTKRVLLAVEGKDAGVWERFADELFSHNGHPKAITQIAIDMSPAYVRGVRENFANATVVYDKFHVVSQVARAVEEVRRKEVRVDATAREHLEKTCWLWRKNPESWTEKEGRRWEQLSDKPLVTGLAYAMRLELQKAYASGSAAVARTRLVNWCRWVKTEAAEMTSGLLAPMRQAAEMVERHLEGILGHWQRGLTTAFLEGLNSLFSATKRKARGYRSTEYQTAMLYFVAGKLEIPYYG
ncbi:MAG: ISL3 family transposase [Verrucomicrobiota bacterium]|nr:ISL3 family transposase [Verrucomicrobiota bacterium]